MSRIMVVPPSPRVRSAADRVTEALIAAGAEYVGWTLRDAIDDVLSGTPDAEIAESVEIVMRRDDGAPGHL